MKEVSKYQCEICGTEYKYKTDAESCERGHIPVVGKNEGIMAIKYLPINNDRSGYPAAVNIKMGNGKVITYKRG